MHHNSNNDYWNRNSIVEHNADIVCCGFKEKYKGKRLHCALNISFHDSDIDNLKSNLDYFKQYPIDAFIVQDIGIVPLLQKHFPNKKETGQSIDCPVLCVSITYLPGPSPDKYFRQKRA